jgi:hypothetical protein
MPISVYLVDVIVDHSMVLKSYSTSASALATGGCSDNLITVTLMPTVRNETSYSTIGIVLTSC